MRWYRFSSMMQRLVPLFAVIVLFADAAVVRAQEPPAGQVPASHDLRREAGSGDDGRISEDHGRVECFGSETRSADRRDRYRQRQRRQIDAITAVLKEMAAERTATREQIVPLGRRMMGHMMDPHERRHAGTICPMNEGARETGRTGSFAAPS